MSAGAVRRQTDGQVAVLTLDRPAKLNALTSGNRDVCGTGDLQTICFATSDAAEGRAAFAERRRPAFRGR